MQAWWPATSFCPRTHTVAFETCSGPAPAVPALQRRHLVRPCGGRSTARSKRSQSVSRWLASAACAAAASGPKTYSSPLSPLTQARARRRPSYGRQSRRPCVRGRREAARQRVGAASATYRRRQMSKWWQGVAPDSPRSTAVSMRPGMCASPPAGESQRPPMCPRMRSHAGSTSRRSLSVVRSGQTSASRRWAYGRLVSSSRCCGRWRVTASCSSGRSRKRRRMASRTLT
mmetsp:Transcript_102570/g.265244  ORF Transcript_102570/g.265244 Transcript_102570/m.265244 type:complete len:230 (-) Transcript_102570:429-1118(-)